MLSFFQGWRRKPVIPRILTTVGMFAFDGRWWSARSCVGDVDLYVLNNDFDAKAIEAATKLLGGIDQLSQEAISFAIANGGDVWDMKSKLKLESIDITEIRDGRYALTFCVLGEEDATVSVEFKDEKPTEVWAGD
jgi:hypothetical protein